jgi:hypothetical protein
MKQRKINGTEREGKNDNERERGIKQKERDSIERE